MVLFDMEVMKQELRRDEGFSQKLYVDTVGKHTIACGRNLDDVGISDDEGMYLLQNDIDRACQSLDANLPWWENLDPIRQRVLVNMCFNMGIGGLMGFQHTLACVQQGDWQGAHDGMLASHWASQVGARATRLATLMLTGVNDGTN